MRVLVVDTELAGLDFAIRCAEDGHEVQLFQQTKHPIGRGFEGVKRTDDLNAGFRWVGKDGLVFPTGNAKFLHRLDQYRDLGYGIFGPTVASAKLEIDRAAGMEALKAAGIDVPHYEEFSSLEEARRFARKADQAYVFKTLGSEEDKALTYCASDPADLVGWIERQIARGMKLSGPCMLQEKIDMLCEMGVSGWVGPQGFLPDKFQICFEHKKLMDGEIGPNTGEQGTVCQYVEEDPLVDILKALELTAIKSGHRGDFSIGFGIDTAGKAWPFELTCRAGWPCWYIQVASHKGDVAQWMRDLLDGEDTLKVDRRAAIGVVMAQPPYPKFNGDLDLVDGNPVSGIEEVRSQVHPVMMQMGKAPVMQDGKVVDGVTYQTAGELVCVVTGLGSTIEKARERTYEAVGDIKFPDAMYRTDIGCKVIEALPDLHKHGYAKSLA